MKHHKHKVNAAAEYAQRLGIVPPASAGNGTQTGAMSDDTTRNTSLSAGSSPPAAGPGRLPADRPADGDQVDKGTTQHRHRKESK